MIGKIISGGQTGADRAALDAAIELGIPHGGWVPKGRRAEDGPLPAKYRMLEMPTESYPPRTEQNLIDSHGTLIVTHGKLTGGSALTKRLATKHKRPCLHIDLTQTNAFLAAGKIINWLFGNAIEILNVAGPRASKDPNIYLDTLKLLKAVHHMVTVNEEMPDPASLTPTLPRTVEEAVDWLIRTMALKDRIKVARMPEEDMQFLYPELGTYVKDRFGLWNGNTDLLRSCRAESGQEDLHVDSAATIIIRGLWERLRTTHSLRAV